MSLSKSRNHFCKLKIMKKKKTAKDVTLVERQANMNFEKVKVKKKSDNFNQTPNFRNIIV